MINTIILSECELILEIKHLTKIHNLIRNLCLILIILKHLIFRLIVLKLLCLIIVILTLINSIWSRIIITNINLNIEIMVTLARNNRNRIIMNVCIFITRLEIFLTCRSTLIVDVVVIKRSSAIVMRLRVKVIVRSRPIIILFLLKDLRIWGWLLFGIVFLIWVIYWLNTIVAMIISRFINIIWSCWNIIIVVSTLRMMLLLMIRKLSDIHIIIDTLILFISWLGPWWLIFKKLRFERTTNKILILLLIPRRLDLLYFISQPHFISLGHRHILMISIPTTRSALIQRIIRELWIHQCCLLLAKMLIQSILELSMTKFLILLWQSWYLRFNR